MNRLAITLILTTAARLHGAAKAPADPRITSIHPFAIRAGASTNVTIRGAELAGARALVFDNPSITAQVLSADPEQVRVEVKAAPEFTGAARLRLIAARGVTNELPLRVIAEEVLDEPTSPVAAKPLAITGRIAARGETDIVWLEVRRGEALTFTALSGVPGFDPSLTIAEPSGSWFDPDRRNRIAFNDEPLHFPGLAQDARLVHRFDKAGRYAIEIKAFGGQGGPDFTYLLRIEPGMGETPKLHPPTSRTWDERRFTRRLDQAWMQNLSARGAAVPLKAPAILQDDGVLSIPGIIEGRIAKPAQVRRVRLAVDKPQDLAIEVETPEATMPRFNPVIRLLAPDGGHEIVTNVYTKRNNNGLYMMKMIQAKSTVTLRSSGEYVLEIRDITTDVAGDDFAYRVLVRPQIPHVGKVDVPEDRINLEPGESKPITINLEREEAFNGLVLAGAEGLPAAVSAMAGMANPVERPPLPNGGRVERYTGKPQTLTLILTAAEDAKPSDVPAAVRIFVRTLSDGRQGPPIPVKEIPVMVIPRRPS